MIPSISEIFQPESPKDSIVAPGKEGYPPQCHLTLQAEQLCLYLFCVLGFLSTMHRERNNAAKIDLQNTHSNLLIKIVKGPAIGKSYSRLPELLPGWHSASHDQLSLPCIQHLHLHLVRGVILKVLVNDLLNPDATSHPDFPDLSPPGQSSSDVRLACCQ